MARSTRASFLAALGVRLANYRQSLTKGGIQAFDVAGVNGVTASTGIDLVRHFVGLT